MYLYKTGSRTTITDDDGSIHTCAHAVSGDVSGIVQHAIGRKAEIQVSLHPDPGLISLDLIGQDPFDIGGYHEYDDGVLHADLTCSLEVAVAVRDALTRAIAAERRRSARR